MDHSVVGEHAQHEFEVARAVGVQPVASIRAVRPRLAIARASLEEREPAERTTVIKKDHDDDGVRSKTIIKDRD